MRRVVVGKVRGTYGVRGWIRVHSYTDPPANLLNYQPWYLRQGDMERECRVLAGKQHGNQILASLDGVGDPEAARALHGIDIVVDREVFPDAGDGTYYWIDLIGLTVRNLEHIALGTVHDVMATGANDVLIVRGDRERLIPFVMGRTVQRVDLTSGDLLVDWDADF